MSDTQALKEAAEKALNAAVEVEMFQKGSYSHSDADTMRILALSEMRYKCTPQVILALLSENAKMRKALKPFADEAAQYVVNDDDPVPDDDDNAWDSDFTVGELLRARAAMGDKND